MEKNNKALTLDLKNPNYEKLSKSAERVATLLAEPSVRSRPDLAGSVDDFLGAIYALILARQHDFVDRSGSIEIAAVENRAKDIALGKVRIDGKWTAGFYFNSALFRIACVLHRVLKFVVGKKENVPQLLKKAQTLYPSWTGNKLVVVHDQVNDLKHTLEGVHDLRTAKYGDAIEAVEELLSLIEAWVVSNRLSGTKP